MLIKLYHMGVKGKIFRWIRNFLTGRKIAVRVGKNPSGILEVDNGTPRGSIISPILLSVIIYI